MTEEEALKKLQAIVDADHIWILREDSPERIFVSLDQRGDELCKLLSRISSLRGVVQGGCSDDNLTDAGLLELTGHPGIEEVFLNSRGITAKGFEVLPTLPRLRELGITIKKCVDFACPSIGRCQNLEKLSFNGGEISDLGLKELAPLSKLTELELSCNPVCKEVRVCAQMPRLAILRLESTNVDDEGLIPLRGHPGLRDLFLDDSKITDESGVILATIPNLTKLSLENTGITDKTGVALGKAQNLEFLSIGGTKVSVETIRAFKQARKLETLMLEKIVIDDQVVKAMYELPNLQKVFMGGPSYLRITRTKCQALHKRLQRGVTVFYDD